MNTFCILWMWLIYCLFSFKEVSPFIDLCKNACLLVLLIILVSAVYRCRHKEIYQKEFCLFSVLCIILALVSLVEMIIHHKFLIMSFMEIFKIWLPFCVAYFILNILSEKEMRSLINGILIITFSVYIVRNLQKILDGGLAHISFANSASPFEDNLFPMLAMGMFIYFLYFSFGKWQFVVSSIFIFMTFKRMNIIMGIFLLMIVLLQIKDKQVPNIILIFGKILTPVGVYLLYQNFIEGSYDIIGKYFKLDLANYSMGRNWMLRKLLDSGFQGYGYKSSVDWNSVDIEMDLIRIMVELSIVGLYITVWLFFDIAGRQMYMVGVLIYFILQCLTGHVLDSTYCMILFYMAIGMVKTYGKFREDYIRKLNLRGSKLIIRKYVLQHRKEKSIKEILYED